MYRDIQSLALNEADPGEQAYYTSRKYIFDWLEEHGIQPQTLVFLTDLYGTFPDDAPHYPVLWATTGGRHAPFGSVIPMLAA